MRTCDHDEYYEPDCPSCEEAGAKEEAYWRRLYEAERNMPDPTPPRNREEYNHMKRRCGPGCLYCEGDPI